MRIFISRKTDSENFDEFNPAMLEILVRPPSPLGRAIFYTILATVLVTIIWASLVTVEIIAKGEARAIYTTRLQKIQPAHNSVVQEIHVREGQQVAEGDLLVTLDTTEYQAELRSLAYQIASRRADIARLSKLLEILERKDFRSERLSFGEDIPETIAEEQRIRLKSQLTFILNQKNNGENKINNLENEIFHLKDVARSTSLIIEDLEVNLQDNKKLIESGASTRKLLQTIERDILENRRELSATSYSIQNSKSKIATIKNEIANLISETRQKATENLASARESHRLLRDTVTRTEMRRNLNYLTAPIAGTVEQVEVHTRQGVVTAGSTIMSVVPFDSPLEFDVEISTKDIGFIVVGQPVNIKLDTFPFERYGVLKGMVSAIARDAIEVEEDTGHWIYPVRVKPEQQVFDVLDKKFAITSGMTGTIDIITGERSIISYLIEPVVRQVKLSLRER